MALSFQERFMRFSFEGRKIELRAIQGKSSKVKSSNNMTQLLKKGHHGVLAQLCSLDVQISRPSIPVNLKKVIDNHSKVFEEIPKSLPLT
jgi:hypothetical protein